MEAVVQRGREIKCIGERHFLAVISLFVPRGFVTSVFSMQLGGLQDGVPVWILLAVCSPFSLVVLDSFVVAMR